MIRLAVIFYGLMSTVALVWNYLRTGDHEPNLKWESFAEYLSLAVGFGLAVVVLSHLLNRFTTVGRRLETAFKEVLGELSFVQILLLAALSSFGEELFFRGALQDALADYLQSDIAGLIIASVLFGAIHYVPKERIFLAWTFFAVGMGFVLGGLYMWTNNLTHPMVVHFVINLLNLHRINRIPLPGRPPELAEGGPESRPG